MANEEALAIVISARDDASRVLAGVGRQLDLFPGQVQNISRLTPDLDRVSRGFEGIDLSATRAIRGVRGLVVPLVSELAPALGGTVGRLATVTASAAALGTGFGALAIGAVGVAGVLGGQLFASLNEARQATEDFNRAQRSIDFQTVTDGLQKERRELGELTDALDELRAARDAERASRAGVPAEFGLSHETGPDLSGEQRSLEERIARLQARARRLQAFRTGREASAYAEAEGGLPVGFTESADATAQADRRRSGDLARQIREQSITDPIERAYAAQMREADNTILAGSGPEARLVADRMRELGRTTRQGALAARRRAFDSADAAGADDEGLAYGITPDQLEKGSYAAIEYAFRGREAAPEPGIDDVARFEGAAPGIAQDTNAARRGLGEADVRERQRALQLSLETLDLDRQRAAILGTMTPELNAQLILKERDLLLSQQGLTDGEAVLINTRAELAILEQMARLDPLAGLTKGFAESASASREWGTEMLNVAREVDRNISRTFSDGLFNLFTGRKGEDLGKRFFESLLRTATDVAGRQLSGAVSGLFSQGLQGFRSVVPGAAAGGGGGGFDLLSLLTGGGGGGATISPTGLPAGQLVMTANGVGQVTPTGAVQLLTGQGVGGAGGPYHGYGYEYGGGGGFDIGGDTAIGGLKGLYGAYQGFAALGSNYAVGGITGALFGVPTVVAGGTTIAVPVGTSGYALAELGAVGVDATVGAGTAGFAGSGGTIASSGASVAGAATGVLAAVALGFTIYSGLEQERTAQNIAMNAVSGAISGAVLGAVIGSIFPGVGTVIGGVIGAIAGGAAAGGTTGLKAGNGKLRTGERSKQVGEAGAGSLSSAIDRAASIEDLVTIFNTQWAPHGEVQIRTTYQGLVYWAGDFDDPPGAAATPALMVTPEFLDALEILVGETGAPQLRPDLVAKFRAKRDELLEVLSAVPFGILERDPAAGVTRRTYLPFQELYKLQPGRSQLVYSSEIFRRDLGADDATVAFLIQRINEVGNKRDMDVTRREFLFGLGGI